MTENKSIWTAFVKQPLSIAVLVLAVVIVVIYLDYRNLQVAPGQAGSKVVGGSTQGTGMPFVPKAPNLNDSGRSMPKIVENMGSSSTAPMLGGLLDGLKAKVEANPNDVAKRILLAQTYHELGKNDEAMDTLNKLRKDFPDHARVKLVAASLLSQQVDEKNLKQALSLLDDLAKAKDASVDDYLIEMYKGDAYIRLKDHKGALEHWKQALATMPKEDNRYSMLEERVKGISSGKKSISKPNAG